MIDRRQSLLLRLLLIPAAIIAGVRHWLADLRCWALHNATQVRPLNTFDRNAYWVCDCGRRLCERTLDLSTLDPDTGWLNGGEWSPEFVRPTSPPPPQSGTAARRPHPLSRDPQVFRKGGYQPTQPTPKVMTPPKGGTGVGRPK